MHELINNVDEQTLVRSVTIRDLYVENDACIEIERTKSRGAFSSGAKDSRISRIMLLFCD